MASAIVIQLFEPEPTARVYEFPRDRVVRSFAPPIPQSTKERLSDLAAIIQEELDKAPPRPKKPDRLQIELLKMVKIQNERARQTGVALWTVEDAQRHLEESCKNL